MTNTVTKPAPSASVIGSDVTSMTFTEYQTKLENKQITRLGDRKKSAPNSAIKLDRYKTDSFDLKSVNSRNNNNDLTLD